MIYGPGHWTRAEILKTPAREVFQHIVLSQRFEADQRSWQVTAGQIHRMDKRGRKKTMDSLRQKENFGRRRKKATSLVDGSTRILMIGSELTVHGEKWSRLYPEELVWLEGQGITPEEAVRRHRAWLDEERKHPFWRNN